MNVIIDMGLRLMKWVWGKITYPFSKALPLFGYIFLCLFVPMAMYVVGRAESFTVVLGIFSRCFSLAYLFTFIVGISKAFMPIVRFGVFWAVSIYTIINFYCLLR